jgi:hypothetical protein
VDDSGSTGEVVFYAMDHCDRPDVAATTIAPSFDAFLDSLIADNEMYGLNDEG